MGSFAVWLWQEPGMASPQGLSAWSSSTVMSSSPAVGAALCSEPCLPSLHTFCEQGMAGAVHIFAQTISPIFLVLANKGSKRPPHPPSPQVMAALFPHDNFIILFEYIYMLLSHT